MHCDPHIHLLPAIDNGPATVAESLMMLRLLSDGGYRRVIITPHFYHERESVSAFRKRTQLALRELITQAHDIRRLSYALSAEVCLAPGVSRLAQLERLLIPNTRLLPLELPLGRLDDWAIRELSHLIHKRNITPMICQTERYFLLYSPADYTKLSSLPRAVYEFTATSLLNGDILGEIVRQVAAQKPVFLASNAHNATDRRPIDKSLAQKLKEQAPTAYKILTERANSYFEKVFNPLPSCN